jgi:hypothetical protein
MTEGHRTEGRRSDRVRAGCQAAQRAAIWRAAQRLPTAPGAFDVLRDRRAREGCAGAQPLDRAMEGGPGAEISRGGR